MERIGKILKDGTSEIIGAVKDGKLKSDKAYNIIVGREREAKTGRPAPTGKKLRVDVNEIVGTWLSEEELAIVRRAGESLESHAKVSLKRHVRWLHQEEGMRNGPEGPYG